VSGVSRVLQRESRDGRMLFEVESIQGRTIRADLARAVVESGWNLNELRPVSLSLEEVFLQLTGTDAEAAAEPVKETVK
jgi:ABC-2 type transport system ATP-binding protein